MFKSCDEIPKRKEIIKKIIKMTKWQSSETLSFIEWDDREEKFYIYLGNGKKISDDSVDILLTKYYHWLKKYRKEFDINYDWI